MTLPPEISVVVPAYNVAGTIVEQLAALHRQQTARTFEVIVADNGSTDATPELVRRYARDHGWSALRLIDASGRRGSAHARNRGAEAAGGSVLAFCDADDVVEPGWLEALAQPVTEERLVFGSLRVDEINEPHVTRWRGRPHAAALATGEITQSFAPSGNMALARSAYLSLGGMNEEYPKSHDVEFSFRATTAGMKLYPAPDAVIHYRFRSTLRGVFRQGFRSGRAAAQLYAQFRHESARRSASTSLRSYWWLLTRVPFLALRDRRGRWIGALGSACGHLVGSIRYRVWYL